MRLRTQGPVAVVGIIKISAISQDRARPVPTGTE